LLAHGQWYSPGTPASSTTKTGRHDIAEILLKVALNTKNQIITDFLLRRTCCIHCMYIDKIAGALLGGEYEFPDVT